MTLKPSNKPREFWLSEGIDLDYNDVQECFLLTRKPDKFNGTNDTMWHFDHPEAFHVIEKSYADKLEKALSVLSDQIQRAKDDLEYYEAKPHKLLNFLYGCLEALAQAKGILE